MTAPTSADALLDQLNGDLPPLAPGEAAPVPPASRDSELTVGAAPAPSPVQAADAAHSTRAGGKGWLVKVKGEFLAPAPDGRRKVKKPYEAEFGLPNLDAALSNIRKNLLEPKLRKMFPDFAAVYTAKIVGTRPLSPETPLSNNLAYMNREQLEAHVKSIRAPIDLAAYPDVTDLRDAVIDYTQTPSGFEAREKARQSDRAAKSELAALNPDIDVNS